MFYLFEETEKKLIDSCDNISHKDVILRIYCSNNDINYVENRQSINEICRSSGHYCYKLKDDQYIILYCIFHPAGYIFNQYVEKRTVNYLYFLKYSKNERNIEICLKQIKKINKINNDDIINYDDHI